MGVEGVNFGAVNSARTYAKAMQAMMGDEKPVNQALSLNAESTAAADGVRGGGRGVPLTIQQASETRRAVRMFDEKSEKTELSVQVDKAKLRDFEKARAEATPEIKA